MARLDEDAIAQRLAAAPGWEREGEAIVRERQFADFAAALAHVNAVGAVAEERGHHPDVLLHGWNRVKLTVSTHSEGGLTEADFALAAALDEL
jgi:4a-hydroxytetrahydrobiopterin dehydratase